MTRSSGNVSPQQPDLVGPLVERLQEQHLLGDAVEVVPLASLVETLAEASHGIAVALTRVGNAAGRVVAFSAAGHAQDQALQVRLTGATIAAEELGSIVSATSRNPDIDLAALPFAFRGALEGHQPACSRVVRFTTPDQGAEAVAAWVWFAGDVDIPIAEADRAASVSSMALALLAQRDGFSSAAMFAQMESSERRDAADVAERLVDGVGAALNHEVRDALRNVVGWSRLASANDIGETVRYEMIRKIQRATETASATVGDALELIREGQSCRTEHSPVDLNGVLSWVTDILAGQIRASHARVTSSTLPTVVASPTALRLVLLELVRNSVEHAGRFVQITVAATLVDGALELRVSDNGPGLDADAKTAAFDPGYSTGVGTGYGLTRVRNSLREHGGDIWFEGAPVEGATVAIKLPQSAVDFSLDV